MRGWRVNLWCVMFVFHTELWLEASALIVKCGFAQHLQRAVDSIGRISTMIWLDRGSLLAWHIWRASWLVLQVVQEAILLLLLLLRHTSWNSFQFFTSLALLLLQPCVSGQDREKNPWAWFFSGNRETRLWRFSCCCRLTPRPSVSSSTQCFPEASAFLRLVPSRLLSCPPQMIQRPIHIVSDCSFSALCPAVLPRCHSLSHWWKVR